MGKLGTAQQDRAIGALLQAATIGEAAKQVGVHERTLRRWLTSDVEFQARYREARKHLVTQANSQLHQAMPDAVVVLQEIMGDQAQPPASRVRAAVKVIELGARAFLVEDLEDRIAALERAAAGEPPVPVASPEGDE